MYYYMTFYNLCSVVLCSLRITVAGYVQVMFVVGGWSGGSATNAIETYDTRADRWIKVDCVDRGKFLSEVFMTTIN